MMIYYSSWILLILLLFFMSLEDILYQSVPSFVFVILIDLVITIGYLEDGGLNLNRYMTMLFVFVLFTVFETCFYLLKNTKGLGEGDIYLFSLLCSLLGFDGSMYFILLSCILGCVYFLICKEEKIAFIPCICLAFLLIIVII